MGFRYRKSVNVGPFRFTASKSGISTSFGGKGARITKTASGRMRTTLSIPGTGISYVSESGKKKKKRPTPAPAKKEPAVTPQEVAEPIDFPIYNEPEKIETPKRPKDPKQPPKSKGAVRNVGIAISAAGILTCAVFPLCGAVLVAVGLHRIVKAGDIYAAAVSRYEKQISDYVDWLDEVNAK
ncbi:MAG: DUF4236 domain-containing protein [Faecalibacterium sp.]|nr:DUF4236 domain-containing protein [Faecalibacterium sp.]